MTCHECKKDTPILPPSGEYGSERRECYLLSNKSTETEIGICADCWDKTDKEKYKQEFENIRFYIETSPDGFKHVFSVVKDEYIQAICEEKGCDKKFDCQTAEKYRHKY